MRYGRRRRFGPLPLWTMDLVVGTRIRKDRTRFRGYWTRGQIKRAKREAAELAAVFADTGTITNETSKHLRH